MSHLIWLQEAHLKRIQHLFPKLRGVERVDDRRWGVWQKKREDKLEGPETLFDIRGSGWRLKMFVLGRR